MQPRLTAERQKSRRRIFTFCDGPFFVANLCFLDTFDGPCVAGFDAFTASGTQLRKDHCAAFYCNNGVFRAILLTSTAMDAFFTL